MEESERRRLRERNVLLATAGLLVTILVGYAMRLLGISQLDYREWTLALGVTLALQLLLWLIPHFGLDARLTGDPHYMVVPMLATVFLLNVYVYVAPDSRVRVLMLWFAALLFMAGLAGFRTVALMGLAMATGYLAAVALRAPGMPMGDDVVLAGVFLLINLYAGIVFERLQRERAEMQALRRRLADHALTDALTGLPNRRRFDEAMRAELTRMTRYGGCCSVAMLDVDHFKSYNDRLGHPAGDAVLKQLAEVLRRELRAGDLAARYGGEEFAVLMVNTGLEAAVQVVDRLRRLVEATEFAGRHLQPGGLLTLSAGVAEWVERQDEASFLATADAALYRAKTAGRNRVWPAHVVL